MDIKALTSFGRHHIRFLKWTALIVSIYALVGFVVMPSVIRPVLMDKLSALLGRQVTVERVEINPFALSLRVLGVDIKDKSGEHTELSFAKMYVDLESISVFKRGVVVGEFSLVDPYVSIARNEDMTYNFSDLLELGGKDEKKEDKGEPFRFSVNNINITNGKVEFADMPMGTAHTVEAINVSVPFVSNFGYYGDTYVKPFFSAVVNGTPFELLGRTKPFAKSLETEFDININDLDIPYYMTYLPPGMNFSIPTGRLDINTTVSYIQHADGGGQGAGVYGTVELRQFGLADRDGNVLLTVPDLLVAISRTDLMAGEVSLSKVVIDSPTLEVAREQDGSINLMKLAPEKKEEPPAAEAVDEEKPEKKYSVEVGFFKLANASVSFTDKTVKGPFTALFSPIDVTVVNLNTIEDWKTQISASVHTDAGEDITLNSHLTVDPPGFEGTLDVRGVPIVRYRPYFPPELNADVTGMLDVFTKFYYSADEDKPAQRVEGFGLDLRELNVRKKGEDNPALRVPEFHVADTSADTLTGEVVVGAIRSEGGVIRAKRYEDGKINFATLYEPKQKAENPPEKKPAEAGEGKEWVVTLGELDVSGYELQFDDMAAPKPVSIALNRIGVKGAGITTRKDGKGDLSASFLMGRKGSFAVDGKVGLTPVTADMRLKVKDIDFTPVQPYFTEKTNILLTGGNASAEGRVRADMSDKDNPLFGYSGMAAVTELATVDKAKAEDLLKWKSLYVTGIDFVNAPMKVDVGEVALTDFYARIIVNEDRSLNIKKAEENGEGSGETEPVPEEAPAPEPQPEKKPAASKIDVKKVTVQGGDFYFTDRSASPTFQVSLTKMGGRVTGLTSLETGYADVDVKALYNSFGPIEITGKINPLRDDLFVDLKAAFTDIELSPFTPYSGKYMGYTIKKGKLSLDLKYYINHRELEASNKIIVDQLTLGDPVDSPDATSLPVKLAIALLKDRNGVIDIDMPLTGNLDDPEFSIWGIVWKVFVNLVTKAVTSPFSLLGSLFGGGEDLGYVEFDYGGYALDPSDISKLEALEKALYERPALKLSIEGHVDVDKDREGLRQLAFDRAVKAEKLKDTIGESDTTVSVDDIVVGPEEYEEYLTEAYEEADFPKPRNIIGMLKSLPVEEMEKLMLTNIKVSDDDLRELARQRADEVKAHILASGQVEQERVFSVEPESLAPEKEEGVKDSRVVFTLE